MIFFLFFLYFCSSVWALESGILKFDQEIKDSIIVDEYPGAITVEYCAECIMGEITVSSVERDMFDADIDKPIWAVDLSKTYISEKDFQYFMKELSPVLENIKILILDSVSLFNIETWDMIYPYLQKNSFKYVNVCGTHVSTKNIVPVLKNIKTKFPTCWKNMTEKIIFAPKSYYKRLNKEMQWPKTCVEEEILSDFWFDIHSLYYTGETEKKMHDKIQNAKPIHYLSGDSDYNQEYETAEELSFLSIN